MEYQKYLKEPPIPAGPGTLVARTAARLMTVHIPDVLADPEYTFHEGQKLGGYRAALGAPLLREGKCIGVMSMTKSVPEPFTDKQIEIVSTFADQAVIAIENARLFGEVRARTAELTASLDNLRTAQDRLVQTEKLASLGQLTAGIAHEIKNPLNFVNNFSAVSAELIDEIRETLDGVKFEGKTGDQLAELMDMLRGNLEKVVQHGKRADSIVKNMLLHSRQGSGEHRPVDINAIVEESLNLAYHGARAEKQGFNITLKRSFDPAAGEADLFPQEITRVLLNLISNGFYAPTRRRCRMVEMATSPPWRRRRKIRATALRSKFATMAAGLRLRSGSECSIRFSQRNLQARAQASACRSAMTSSSSNMADPLMSTRNRVITPSSASSFQETRLR